MTRRSADELVAEARRKIWRIAPSDLGDVIKGGGLLIDIRPAQQRAAEGELPGAIVVERNVLEWRLDPAGDHRLAQLDGYEQPVVIACSEGYASSLAAAVLVELGLNRAADLDGGYRAWRAWTDALATVP